MQISAVSAVNSSLNPSTRVSAHKSLPATGVPAPATSASTSAAPVQTGGGVTSDHYGQIYATRVAGKNYSGEVTYTSGVYTMSIANLPGATASGSNLSSAENALNARIDLLV